jgi:Styrene monooxygenase A putative substrate binding domain
MISIGIVGAGVAGLQLGLFLQQHGIAATIYAEKTPQQQLAARLSNIVIRSAPTRERERFLGVNHWDAANLDLWRWNFHIGGERPFAFSGDLSQPVIVVDMRMYYARLLEDFAQRGGGVVVGALQAGDVQRLAAHHDLMVLASGRGRLASMFPRLPAHSPYRTPQRLCVAGLYRGIAEPQPLGIDIAAAPGHGDIFAAPLVSFEPHLTSVGFFIIAGGAFEVLKQMRYADDSRCFGATVLSLLRTYAPAIYARVDPSTFALTRPLDLCHAAMTPTVRRGYIQLQNGTFAVALGDAHVLNDPITGQGANTASHAAWVLGQAIRDSGATFDAAFCRRVEQQIWAYARPITEACNARLRPPPAHAVELLVAAAYNKTIADAHATGFNHPDSFWEIVSSPERTAAFLTQCGWRGLPVAARAA